MQGAEACEGLRDPRTRGGNAGIDQELAVSTGEDSNIAAGAFVRSLWTLIGAVAGFSRSRFILTSCGTEAHLRDDGRHCPMHADAAPEAHTLHRQ
jgi:hypothetical protein